MIRAEMFSWMIIMINISKHIVLLSLILYRIYMFLSTSDCIENKKSSMIFHAAF